MQPDARSARPLSRRECLVNGGRLVALGLAAGAAGWPALARAAEPPGAQPATTSATAPTVFHTDSDGRGRILVADSLTFYAARDAPDLSVRDVVLGASFCGGPTGAVPLGRGVRALIAHDAGGGRDLAGIAALPLAQKSGIPAAAIACFTARLSDGPTLLRGTVSYVNEAAAALGAREGMAGEEVARLFLAKSPEGRAVDVRGATDEKLHHLEGDAGGAGGIFAAWTIGMIKERRAADVFCVGSHGAAVMARYAQTSRPKGIIANDAGFGIDQSGANGLPALEAGGVAAATVSTYSARIGDALSTWNDGIISAANPIARSRGVKVGMTAKDAARLMLRAAGGA